MIHLLARVIFILYNLPIFILTIIMLILMVLGGTPFSEVPILAEKYSKNFTVVSTIIYAIIFIYIRHK